MAPLVGSKGTGVIYIGNKGHFSELHGRKVDNVLLDIDDGATVYDAHIDDDMIYVGSKVTSAPVHIEMDMKSPVYETYRETALERIRAR